jgi:hypothetical protein
MHSTHLIWEHLVVLLQALALLEAGGLPGGILLLFLLILVLQAVHSRTVQAVRAVPACRSMQVNASRGT